MAAKNLNVDELVAATTPPSITINGTTYVGRLLTVQEMAKFLSDVEAVGIANDDGSNTFEKLTECVKIVCDAMKIPVEPILELPIQTVNQVIQHFLAQARDS